MGVLRDLLLGRPDGRRARLRRKLGLGGGQACTKAEAPPAPPPAAAGWGREPAAAEPALGLSPEAPKDVTPPEGFEVVLHKDALPAGQVVEIIIGGTAIAVANVEGTFHAVTNTCPHAGGPLGEGTLDGHDLTCPYHGWTFDVGTGACKTNPDVVLRRYDVVVERDAVCVRL
ncbi:Rieske (2Fe-2S) protein [Myxococcota bacterium]|nr:Rieske (2Fe-2S) protein [Myxococcota bacterium]